MKKMKQLQFSYIARHNSGIQTMEGPIQLDLLKMGSSSNGSIEHEDSVIKVDVEWDGQREQFELTKDK